MDLNASFKAAHASCREHPYPSVEERKKWLNAMKRALQHEAEHLAEAVNKDFGHRSKQETLFLEIFPTLKAINFCLKKINAWTRQRPRKVSWLFFPAKAYVTPQPLGIVGNLVPWNYPIYLALVPVVYALAAGNRVMIKMSELSPHTGLALHSLVESYNMSHFIRVINGSVDVSREFAALPFGHLLFTGSTNVGKQVMKAASAHLTPVTLELGGKSPALLSKTMNPAYFKRVFMGKLFNAAQTCVAPDYLLAPMGWDQRIEDAFEQFITVHYPDLMNNANYSSIINEEHKLRLMDVLEDAKNKGARIVSFGEFVPNSNKMPVSLVFGATPDMILMQEELFGPILPVFGYQSFHEAVEYINSQPNPLALYYFGEDKHEIELIKTQTLSGALTINDTVMHIGIDDLPFGGVGSSGMGHYHGQEGFDAFSKLKPVFIQRRVSPVSWLYPPYGVLVNLLLKWVGGIKLSKNRNE